MKFRDFLRDYNEDLQSEGIDILWKISLKNTFLVKVVGSDRIHYSNKHIGSGLYTAISELRNFLITDISISWNRKIAERSRPKIHITTREGGW